MITRIFFFLLGFILMVMGFMYMMIYINLLSFGYTYFEYYIYILTHYECLIAILGFIIVLFSLFGKGKSHVKCVRHHFKFIR